MSDLGSGEGHLTNTTVLPDQTDESAQSGIESPAATNTGSHEDFRSAFSALLAAEDASAEATPSERENVGAETPTEPEPGNAADEALTPDDDADEPSSRRGKASIRELREEIQQLRAQIATPQTEVPPQPDVREMQEQDALQKAQGTIAELRGDDAEYKRLGDELLDSGLSFLDAERYRRMKVAREFETEWQTLGDTHAATRFSKYQNGFFTSVAQKYEAVKGKPGVDPDFVQNERDMGKIFDHIYEAGRSALADENEQLKGEIKELKAKAMSTTPRLATGGRSSMGATNRDPGPDASTRDLFRAGVSTILESDKRRRK